MTSAEIVKALRCISKPAGDKKEDCESCPFYAKEKLDAEWAEKLGVTERSGCDCDAVGIAAADLIERLEKEKAALLESIRGGCISCKHGGKAHADAQLLKPEPMKTTNAKTATMERTTGKRFIAHIGTTTKIRSTEIGFWTNCRVTLSEKK